MGPVANLTLRRSSHSMPTRPKKPNAVGGSVIVGGTLFGAPSTPRCIWVVSTSWRIVGFFGRVGIECEDLRRVRFATGNVAVLFVPSRGASLGFRHGALFGMGSLLRLGRVRRTWGR